MPTTYYEILDIAPNADVDAIKKAWRRLSHEYHPDGSMGDTEKYTKINAAYAVLLDADKRKKYDWELSHPNESQLIINISQPSASSSSSSSKWLVPVTTYNLSELITISDLPEKIIINRLKEKPELALHAWNNLTIRERISTYDWIKLALSFYKNNDARLVELILQAHAHKKYEDSHYLIILAEAHEDIFALMIELHLANIFSGHQIYQIKLKSKSKIKIDLLLNTNAALSAKLNAFKRIIALKSLSGTTEENLNKDIETAFPTDYNAHILQYINGDNALNLFLFRHPKLNQHVNSDWIELANANSEFAELMADEEIISTWTGYSLSRLAMSSSAVFVKLLYRNLLTSCTDDEIYQLHSKYPRIEIADANLQRKLKRATVLTQPSLIAKLTAPEVIEYLAAAEYKSSDVTSFLMKNKDSLTILAFRNVELRKSVYLHRWKELAIAKPVFAVILVNSKYFLKHYALDSGHIKQLALTNVTIAVMLLNSSAATLLNGNDLREIQNFYGSIVLEIISNNPIMTEKICADYEAKHVLRNLNHAVIKSNSDISSSDDKCTRLFKLAMALQSKALFRKGISEFHHKGCFVQLLRIGDISDYVFCYDKFKDDDDEELARLKENCRIFLYNKTTDSKYMSLSQRQEIALIQEHQQIRLHCETLYSVLRNTMSYSFFRSDFFNDYASNEDGYKTYSDMKRHAMHKPNSRTAICLDLAKQISLWNKTPRSSTIVLSHSVSRVLQENKKFLKLIKSTYPGFINQLAEQDELIKHAVSKESAIAAPKKESQLPSESIELVDMKSFAVRRPFTFFLPNVEQLIIERNISNSNEGHPAITNSYL